jgi:hypothetical protein
MRQPFNKLLIVFIFQCKSVTLQSLYAKNNDPADVYYNRLSE